MGFFQLYLFEGLLSGFLHASGTYGARRPCLPRTLEAWQQHGLQADDRMHSMGISLSGKQQQAAPSEAPLHPDQVCELQFSTTQHILCLMVWYQPSHTSLLMIDEIFVCMV
jgi:hypothetical protein